MARRAKIQTRKIEETSWLAQDIADRRQVELDKAFEAHDLYYTGAHWLALKFIINEADNPENHSIYYENQDGQLWIYVCSIPDLSAVNGSYFDTYGMQCLLRGLQERYTDWDGMYTMSVLTTHDLNSCSINVSKLMESIRVKQ